MVLASERLRDIRKLIEIEFQGRVGDFGAYGERFHGGNLASLRSALSAEDFQDRSDRCSIHWFWNTVQICRSVDVSKIASKTRISEHHKFL